MNASNSATPSARTNGAHASAHAEANAVVSFWRNAGPASWFAKNDDFDQAFRTSFCDLHFAAARRECDRWLDDPYGNLALILLLDQFPRNAFRGSAHMYATDSLARAYARTAIDSNAIAAIEDTLKLFVCLPFVHSENIEDQHYALDLYERHSPDNLRHAQEHCEIVRRFGRFPHRNFQLGRASTPAEQAFLDSGGFSG
ncbi:DUF924 family protein [Paralcaligenes sp. KSB-10]|uniref:DUF924 family protein n=1 Tax=Paralcaligenes sp. KSB-10 TaxID=2901142 RepID=UPI001E4A8566|nr:DUF924 family protein [Paralcaligenes sp. KSB-10]UHL65358.1 DUF924 family protein [Paralcaligenes sp. KSB-10]